MDVESLAKQLILQNMTPEQQSAVLESVRATLQEARGNQKRRVSENVGVVVDALRKIEADIRAKYDDLGNKITARVNSIRDGRDGTNGSDGRDGLDGRPGRDGAQGPAGPAGRDGVNGVDGVDGVSVTDAKIDFDGSLVISLSNGREINVGEVVAPDLAERIKVITNGGGTSQTVIDALASLQQQINDLIPSQTGNAGKFLTTNGTAVSWASVAGGLSYQGTWNASANTPTLASGVGINGYYYIVATAGSTSLDGITDWQIGDWLMFNGTVWQKIDQSNLVTSVNGQTGAVSLTTTNINEGTNQYYLDSRARSAISAGTGISYSSSTGVVTNSAPDQTVVLTGGTGISTSGTYPSFTITNSAPDQAVALTGAGTTSISGTYPNFTITSNDQYVGTVTSVTGTSPVASSGGATPAISLASGYGDTQNPYASKTANFVLAAPNGSAGVPTFRAVVAADIPTLNQNTTGTASNVTGTVAIANGGTGETTRQAAIDALAGAVTSGQYLRGNGADVVMSAIQAADVPTLNQNTTGTASNVTGTVAVANGGTGATTAANARTNLSAQETLVSGTNIKTINSTSILGSGNIAISAGKSLLRITRYTSAGSGTWTKPSDTVSVLIRTIAGGGGGGGGSSGVFAGGGGSSGGYAEIYIATAASSYAYTVGAGGSGGAVNGSGGSGGATTIAGIANGGGNPGGTGAAGYGGNAGVGTTPTGGDLNVRGGSGNGGTEGDAAQANGTGGVGGSGIWGGGGRGAGFNSPTGGAGVFGGGGGGGAGGNGGAGGAGGAGYIEIWEFS